MPEMGPLLITVPATPRYVTTLRLVVGGLARYAGCNDEAVADLKLAVSELATAAVEAGIERIDVTGDLVDHQLVVRLPAPSSRPGQMFDPIDIARALVDGCSVDVDRGEVILSVLAAAGRRNPVG
jgi:anti-sigma regulatory factor (Ser/Thr protein kinase)